tara:strand:+ start:470 stop:772 length:303 start_codon:yes stop_codon:yes gene_type:complete
MVKVSIKKSTTKGKKMTAIFFYNKERTKKKTVHFGSAGMDDFTKTGDEEQKKRYLARHQKNENWNDYDTAGALSRWILWNKKSLSSSIADYVKRFNLTLV